MLDDFLAPILFFDILHHAVNSRTHLTVNAADLATVVTLLGCVLGGLLAAAATKAGWFTVVFVAISLVAGIGFSRVVHKLAYWLLFLAHGQKRGFRGWAMLFAYTLIPLVAAFAAVAVTGVLIGWISSHILR